MSALKKMVLLLTAVAVSVPLWAKVELEYFYADDGTLTGRAVNGVRQNFVYDKRGQLLAVKDAKGNDIERYVYDPAGNILSKTIGGVTTKYTYDKANQLLTSTRNGKVTRYEYDAAGRLIREGDKVYFYGYQDKILTITVNGKKELTFDYHMDGQLASAGGNGKSEEFLWDGLALIKRGNTRYVNEPYVTGGNPVIAGNDVMFNDMLGSTVSINDKAVGMTSFGETTDSKAMYTGKPYVDGLGYAFLFRNYRTDLGKWQTGDPLGYPDGWNSLAYCNNWNMTCIDVYGSDIYHVLAPNSVHGFGHSAAIVGNKTFGYRIINHGTTVGISSDYNTWDVKFSTLSEALATLNFRRTGDEAFSKIQVWDTTPAEDDIAYAKMLEASHAPYDLLTNNCWQVIRAGIAEVRNPLYYSFYPIPSMAFIDNCGLLFGAKELDFNTILKNISE